jgi:hypothetical protein
LEKFNYLFKRPDFVLGVVSVDGCPDGQVVDIDDVLACRDDLTLDDLIKVVRLNVFFHQVRAAGSAGLDALFRFFP